jgi:hypothetical protein
LRADFARLPELLAEHVPGVAASAGMIEEMPEPAPEQELVGATAAAGPDQMGLF